MEELNIQSPYCPAMKELFDNFDINSIPKEKRDAMYQSYTDYYIMSLEDYDNEDVESILESNKRIFEDAFEDADEPSIIIPVKETIQIIKNAIPCISEEQFRTITNNGIESIRIDVKTPIFWTQPMFVIIPNSNINVKILDEKMNECGYVNVRKQLRFDSEHRQWWFSIYNPNPKFMNDIRDILDRNRLFHYTPEFNRDSIIDSGLVPSNGGRTYLYPDKRVFFEVTSMTNPYKFNIEYLKMMHGISEKTYKNEYMFSGYFDCFELDISKLPDNVKIYWDPNHRDGVYINCHIEPEWLIFREKRSRTF